MAKRFDERECMITQFSGSTARRATWLIMWAGTSKLNLPVDEAPRELGLSAVIGEADDAQHTL